MPARCCAGGRLRKHERGSVAGTVGRIRRGAGSEATCIARPFGGEPPRMAALVAPPWWRSALVAAAVAAAATWWLAATVGALPVVHGTLWLVLGLVVLPVAFAVALALVAAVLSVLLAALALPAWWSGRPTGLGSVLRDAWRLAGAVLPGFGRALRRVRRPRLWGAVGGHLGAIGLFVARHGFAAVAA